MSRPSPRTALKESNVNDAVTFVPCLIVELSYRKFDQSVLDENHRDQLKYNTYIAMDFSSIFVLSSEFCVGSIISVPDFLHQVKLNFLSVLKKGNLVID